MNSTENYIELVKAQIKSIAENVTLHNQEEETSSAILEFIIVTIMLCLLVGVLVLFYFPWFPIVLVFLCAGSTLQMLLQHVFPSDDWNSPRLLHSPYLHILQFFVMPLQMFRYGFQINSSLLMKNLKSVLALSVGENILFIFLFSFIWYSLPPYIGLNSFGFWNTLAFCASMVASDSSFSVNFFRSRKCSNRLTTLMEGDTIFSEIFSILLFRTIVYMQVGSLNSNVFSEGIVYFFSFLITTLLIGTVIGIGSSILFKVIHRRSSTLEMAEVGLFILVPVTAYMWAEGLHVSSYITIRICGIFMSRYTQYNLNSITYPFLIIIKPLNNIREFLHSFIRLLGMTADLVAFLIIGMLSYVFNPLAIDFRWLILAVSITFISRYTAVATILDIFPKIIDPQSHLSQNKQINSLYFVFPGSVAILLVSRMEGELLDNSSVNIMLRLVLAMIWLSLAEIVIIANPLLVKNQILRRISSLEERSFSNASEESERESNNNTSDVMRDAYFEAVKQEAVVNSLTDALFPYLVRMDTTPMVPTEIRFKNFKNYEYDTNTLNVC